MLAVSVDWPCYMGMFDTVFVPCPHCGRMVEFQSKAGDCELKRYHISSVPPEIAKWLDGDNQTCACNAKVTIRLSKPLERVLMTTDPADSKWD